jgi:C-terminal processing protease CtpA/Prc
MLICILLVTSVPAFGVFLRSRSSTPFHNPVEKVKRLVLDIEESVRKSGEDSDSVFSTLQSYDKQLDNSLEQELGMLNQTLVRLLKMQTTYSMDMKSKNARSAHLRTAAKASEQMATHYEAGTADTRTGFDSLEDRTDMLVSVLRTAGVSPQGRLVTPEKPDSAGEPQLILSAIRRVLSSNPGLRFSHPEVFAAFLPSVANATAEPQELYPVVEMTPNLLQATIDTLVEIKGRLRSTKSQTLLQFGALHREFEQDALLNMAESNAQQGLEAENEQKAQEVTFSIKFTKAVIDMDQKFRQSVTDHVRSTSDLVYQIRDLREAQLKILHDVSIALNAQGASSMEGLSFLETTLDRSQPQDGFAALQSEVEAVTRNHGDTHDLLMQVKDMLEQQAEGGPAEKAGVKTGDVILKFNNIAIENMKELPKVVAGTPVGKSVPLVILRNGKELTLNVTLGELELAEKENLIGKTSSKNAKAKEYDKLGFVAEELNSKNKLKFKLKNIDKGVIITSVKENSSAQDAGLLPGMVIVRVGQIEVNSLSVVDEAIKKALKQKRKALLLLVKIENGSRFVALELK